MIQDDFLIDFDKKEISYRSSGSQEIHEIETLYLYLQMLFARPENMQYQVPVMALAQKTYLLINGWSIEQQARLHLRGGVIADHRSLIAQ